MPVYKTWYHVAIDFIGPNCILPCECMELPRVLTTDNGSEFKNKLNAEMNKLLG